MVFLFFAFSFLFFNNKVLAAEEAKIDLSCATNPNAYPWCKDIDPKKPFSSLVNNFYNIALGLGAASAFGVLIYGAILWTMSGAVTSKQDAMEWISGAIWGLVLLLGAYIILYTINPQLIELNEPILKKIEIPTQTQPTSATSGFSKGVNTLTQVLSGEPYDTQEECSSASKQYGDRVIGADLSGDGKKCTIIYCKIETKFVQGKGCVPAK